MKMEIEITIKLDPNQLDLLKHALKDIIAEAGQLAKIEEKE